MRRCEGWAPLLGGATHDAAERTSARGTVSGVENMVRCTKRRSAKTISLTTNAIAMSPAKTDALLSFGDSFGGDVVIRISFGGSASPSWFERLQFQPDILILR